MENENQEIVKVVVENQLPQITEAEIHSQVRTAREYPRSMTVFFQKAMSMATFNEEVAELCSYSVPRAGKSIDGASVRLAEIVVSCYGNIRAGSRIIGNDGKHITAAGYCADLENNYICTVEVKRRITDKFGKTYNEDLQTLTCNAAASIAFRNAVFKVVPFAMVQPIYDKAREVAKGTAETLVARRTKAVEYFRTLGIKDAQICEKLEIKKIEDIDLDKLSVLTGMKAAIKNGESTAQSLFESNKDKIDIADLQLLFDMKKSALNEKELADAKRILDNLEEKSYVKLHKLLTSK